MIRSPYPGATEGQSTRPSGVRAGALTSTNQFSQPGGARSGSAFEWTAT